VTEDSRLSDDRFWHFCEVPAGLGNV